MSDLDDIREVVKTNSAGANKLIAVGYRLLDVQTEAEACRPRGGGGNFWVDRRVVFVLGRPERVEPADFKVKKPQPYVRRVPDPPVEPDDELAAPPEFVRAAPPEAQS